MSDYISKTLLLHDIAVVASMMDDPIKIYDQMSAIVKESPAADVVERKRGRWEFSPDHPIAACSVCGGTKAGKLSPFCPWCGAEMDTFQIYLNLESGDSDV